LTPTITESNAELVADMLVKSIVPSFIQGIEGATGGNSLKHLEGQMSEVMRSSFIWCLKGVENMTFDRAATMLDLIGTEAASEHATRVRALSNDLGAFKGWLEDTKKP